MVLTVVPAAIATTVGVWALGTFGSTVGTLGPWAVVAESGQLLIDEATRAAPLDEQVSEAADRHRDALSNSLRSSSLWRVLADRLRAILPIVGLFAGSLLIIAALLAARWSSRTIAKPIHELVGWTERIAQEQPLPTTENSDPGPPEFEVLRSALREMTDRLAAARTAEVRGARLRTWTEMARRVAHELKNPLTPMRIAATQLIRDAERGNTDRVRETVDVLLDEIGRLDEMARSFSQFGRMPEGPPADVDLVELCALLAGRQGVPVDVVVDGDVPLVRGHYDVMSRAIRNLLTNAAEAVEEAGRSNDPDSIRVVIDHVDGGARVRVQDLGNGVPHELLDTIWLPDVTTKSKGTGLGLAVVRQAAELHDGSFTARNKEYGGAEFEIVFSTEAVE